MADTITLEAQPRSITGKKVSQLRAQGLVPAVIYGSRLANPVHLQVPYRPLQVALMQAGGTQLLDVRVDGNSHTVLARDVQRDVIRGDILHVDFMAVDMNQKITTSVPIHVVGESPVVETRQGQAVLVVNALSIEALPSDLIQSIEVDISGLTEVGSGIHVRDLNLGDELTVLADEDELLVHILPVAAAVAEEEEVEVEEGGAAEPEVIRREREEEEDEE